MLGNVSKLDKYECMKILLTTVSAPCFEFNELDFESESNEFELACFDELKSEFPRSINILLSIIKLFFQYPF